MNWLDRYMPAALALLIVVVLVFMWINGHVTKGEALSAIYWLICGWIGRSLRAGE